MIEGQATPPGFFRQIIDVLPVELTVGLILAGLLALLAWIYRWASSKWRHRQFRKVFGAESSEYFLAFGSMVVHPILIRLARIHLKPPDDPDLAGFPLTKPSKSKWNFSAQEVSSGCEIRAIAYVVSAFKRVTGSSVQIVTDESIKNRLDVDFISFGAMSNRKTADAFANSANTLVEYDELKELFVSKLGRAPLHSARRGYDYGIILKVHPAQFPARTWICCAGIGESGTSGAAYFLANKWREIARQVKKDDSFICTIEVQKDKDESAHMLSLRKAAKERS